MNKKFFIGDNANRKDLVVYLFEDKLNSNLSIFVIEVGHFD